MRIFALALLVFSFSSQADEGLLTIQKAGLLGHSELKIQPSQYDFCQHPGTYEVNGKSFTVKFFRVFEGDLSNPQSRCAIANKDDKLDEVPGTLVFKSLHLSPHGTYLYDAEKPHNQGRLRQPSRYTFEGKAYTGEEDVTAVGVDSTSTHGAGPAE